MAWDFEVPRVPLFEELYLSGTSDTYRISLHLWGGKCTQPDMSIDTKNIDPVTFDDPALTPQTLQKQDVSACFITCSNGNMGRFETQWGSRPVLTLSNHRQIFLCRETGVGAFSGLSFFRNWPTFNGYISYNFEF